MNHFCFNELSITRLNNNLNGGKKGTCEMVTLTMSLYNEIGYIVQPYECNNDEIIEYNNVKIKEYPELKIETNGTITFPKNNKYKGHEDVHIFGSITILEPNYMLKYVRISYENVYIKKHYRKMISGTIMCEDFTETYEYGPTE